MKTRSIGRLLAFSLAGSLLLGGAVTVSANELEDIQNAGVINAVSITDERKERMRKPGSFCI